MFQLLIVGPFGEALLRDVRRSYPDRSLFLWTVNEESWMKWSIRQQVDGVVTDDPKMFWEVCKTHVSDEKLHHSKSSWKAIFWQHYRNWAFGVSFRLRHGWWVDVKRVLKNLETLI